MWESSQVINGVGDRPPPEVPRARVGEAALPDITRAAKLGILRECI